MYKSPRFSRKGILHGIQEKNKKSNGEKKGKKTTLNTTMLCLNAKENQKAICILHINNQ